MDYEDGDVVMKKRKVKKGIESDEDDDDICTEYDVVVCEQLPHSELYCVQFPNRKHVAFDPQVNPRARFKKNVRLLEMRLAANTMSGSYDKTKLDRNVVKHGSPVKQEFGTAARSDEIYEGRAFTNENPLQNAVGFVRNGTFYLTPVAGIFNMHRTITELVAAIGKENEDEFMDSDGEQAGGGQQLRVKFSRPETDRQKKRREASALYREKMIASDQWIGMNMHLKGDPAVAAKVNRMVPRDERSVTTETTTMREIALNAIICGQIEQLDLSRENQQMSLQRIKDLPLHLQVKAQVLKAKVISTTSVSRLVSGLSHDDLIDSLRKCANLVQGVWVLKSGLLFHGLAPAHCNVPGKVDEQRSEVWRCARDLALCLLVAGQRVNRMTLSHCFKLDTRDAEEILSTFGVKADRTWKLRISPDQQFLNDPHNLPLMVEERRFWSARWAELQNKLAEPSSETSS